MIPSTHRTETRFVPGLLLLLFGLTGLFAAWVPVLTRSTIMITGLPATVAIACGYCSIVVILCSAVDRADGAATVGAHRLIGRWFLWGGVLLAAFSISLMLTHTLYADDLLNFGKFSVVVAITASIFSLFAYLLQQGQKTKKSRIWNQTTTDGSWKKNGLAVVLCLAASLMLYQRYAEKQKHDANAAARDAAERSSAKRWSLDMEAFQGGMSVQEVRKLAQTTGHFLRCYNDLRSEERVKQDDKSACWINIGNAWGAPALMTAFTFGDNGLRNQLTRFPETSWLRVQQWLDQMGQRLPQTFGIDPETGGAVFGWRLNSGLVFAARPPKGKELTVLWTAKKDVAVEHCPYQGVAARRDPHNYSVQISQLWPEIDCRELR